VSNSFKAISRPIKITLQDPIEAEGSTITELELAIPTLGHMEVVEKVQGTFAQEREMLRLLSAFPDPSIKSVSLRDLEKIGEALKPFLPKRMRGEA